MIGSSFTKDLKIETLTFAPSYFNVIKRKFCYYFIVSLRHFVLQNLFLINIPGGNTSTGQQTGRSTILL